MGGEQAKSDLSCLGMGLPGTLLGFVEQWGRVRNCNLNREKDVLKALDFGVLADFQVGRLAITKPLGGEFGHESIAGVAKDQWATSAAHAGFQHNGNA